MAGAKIDLARFHTKLLKALAYEPGGATVEGVAQAVRSGDAQFWMQGEGIIVTRIKVFGEGRALSYWLAAGDMDDVLDMTPHIEQWAKDEMSCTTAFMTGRRGWSRVLPAHGWAVEPTVNYRKEL